MTRAPADLAARRSAQQSLAAEARARDDLKIPAIRCGAQWYISLPEHEGDLRANSAKSAKTAAPDGVGGVGGVDSAAVRREPKSANTAKADGVGADADRSPLVEPDPRDIAALDRLTVDQKGRLLAAARKGLPDATDRDVYRAAVAAAMRGDR